MINLVEGNWSIHSIGCHICTSTKLDEETSTLNICILPNVFFPFSPHILYLLNISFVVTLNNKSYN